MAIIAGERKHNSDARDMNGAILVKAKCRSTQLPTNQTTGRGFSIATGETPKFLRRVSPPERLRSRRWILIDIFLKNEK